MFKIFFEVVISPGKGWKTIEFATINQRKVLTNFLLPLLLATSLLTFLGVIRIPGTTMQTALKYFLFNFGVGFMGITFSAYVLAKLSVSFKGDGNVLKSLVLASFSLGVFIILSTLGKVIPSLSLVFGLLSLWSIYIFISGVYPILSIQKQRIAGFSLISLLVITLVFFLVYIFFSFFLKIPINL